MKKLLHIVFAIMLFIFAVDSTEVFASFNVKRATVGIQDGVVNEGTPTSVRYLLNIACAGNNIGSTYIKRIAGLPDGTTVSFISDSYPVSEDIIILTAASGTVWLIIENDATVTEGIDSLTLTFEPNVTTNTFTYEVSTAVPVELTTFFGTVSGNVVSLKWTTATEVKNYGFEIERSLSAPKTNWEKIGFINGNGNSNSPKEYSYTDKHLRSGSYLYRIKQIDNDGSYDYSNTIELNVRIPVTLDLKQNYPNPFNPSTTISFTIPTSGDVYLKIFNSLGEEVAKLVNGYAEAGEYTLNFDAGDLPSGMYVYQLKTNESSLTKKMLLLK